MGRRNQGKHQDAKDNTPTQWSGILCNKADQPEAGQGHLFADKIFVGAGIHQPIEFRKIAHFDFDDPSFSERV